MAAEALAGSALPGSGVCAACLLRRIMGADDADLQAADAARQDLQTATRRVEQLQLKVALAKGEAKEAARLRGFTSNAALSARAKNTALVATFTPVTAHTKKKCHMATRMAGRRTGPGTSMNR